MTPHDLTVTLVVAFVVAQGQLLMLYCIFLKLKRIQCDVMHAGIDIHQALVEIVAHQRVTALMQAPPRLQAPPEQPQSEETPEAWLERMRKAGSSRLS